MLKIDSEIIDLKEVLLHRPGKELLNLTPSTLEDLLFDDIPFLKEAQQEHDNFARVLKENGVKVFYLENLMAEAIKEKEIKDKFLREFIEEANIENKYKKTIYNYLNNFKSNKKLILKTMEGIKGKDLKINKTFITNPMPNLYFTRDNVTVIGEEVYINNMRFNSRKRENIYYKYIFKYHSKFKNTRTYNNKYHIEGGDILVLNENTLLIGISQRTEKRAIISLSNKLLKKEKINKIIAIKIPNKRTSMHLDTVITMVSNDKFIYYPKITENIKIYEITANGVKKIDKSLKEALEKILNKKITLIPCAGKDEIDSKREQWSDGSNTLCIKNKVVITYDRNIKTNNLLRKEGIKVIEIKSSELSRGRGGPRCMSAPLLREKSKKEMDNVWYNLIERF